MHRNQGFTLIEVVIVVTIIGLIATLSFQNLLRALDRGRKSATLADMRVIATALERFAVDHQAYPVVDKMAALRGDLEPAYVKQLPLTDGWHHPLDYEVDEAGSTYTLRSPGKDGEFQDAAASEVSDDFAADIVCVDGVFVGRTSEEPDDDPS